LNRFDVFPVWLTKVCAQLKFHFMAAGALCAWWLHRNREAFLRLPVFTSRALQALLLLLLVEYYSLGLVPWGWLGGEAVQMILYSWLIVTVSSNPRNIVRVENRVFEYLGTISYGLYMLHMISVYLTSQVFRSTSWWHGHLWLYCAAYYTMALGLTILSATLSYRWFERPFLRLKDRRFSMSPLAARRATLENPL
jgi:peptidoglycan/LPS O-acetylase OafA/YrhL